MKNKQVWQLPPVAMFPAAQGGTYTYTEHSGADIVDFLTRGGLPCICTANRPGAQVDRYTFHVCDFYKLSRLPRLLPALETWAGAVVRRSEPAPAGAFILEVQRRQRSAVYFGDCVNSRVWATSNPGAALIGAGGAGCITALNIDHAPHVLIAGQTGAGKSVLMNTIICSLLLKNTPDAARFVFIDPKQVEFSCFADLPHVCPGDMVTSTGAALTALQKLCANMEDRYSRMKSAGLKTYTGQQVYIFIDELADLMLTAGKIKKQVEECIIRIAQKGRAAGYHLIIATQTPRSSVITGLISANIPVKIALTVSSVRESVIILGHKNAERLTGRGDCILKTPLAGEMRLQAAFISDRQIDTLIEYWKNQKRPARRGWFRF